MVAPTLKLVEEALAGDAAAVRDLLKVILPAAHAGVADTFRIYVRRESWERADVEDLAQSVLVALFDREAKLLRAWNPALGLALPGYVKLIARSRTVSWLRARRPQDQRWEPLEGEAAEEPDPDVGFDHTVEQNEVVRLVLEAVEKDLPPDAADFFRMCFREWLSVEQIRERTGMSTNAIHLRISRLFRSIREVALRVMGTPET
jgi:RNA polymerase sigma factor (sigma-70 family)